MIRFPLLKTLLVAAVAALALLAAATPPASARNANECWAAIIRDWYDGRIDHTYPIPCYSQAIQHIDQFPDLAIYSDAREAIHQALLAALRQDRGHGPGLGADGMSQDNSSGNDKSGPLPPGGNNTQPPQHRSFVTKAFDKIGHNDAQSVPLPLLILAGIAVLLLLATGASYLARRLQARRVLPAPAPAEAPKKP